MDRSYTATTTSLQKRQVTRQDVFAEVASPNNESTTSTQQKSNSRVMSPHSSALNRSDKSVESAATVQADVKVVGSFDELNGVVTMD